jgi:RNA polymerase sigma-54 factor
MRLSLHILRLPALALQDEIAREGAENPFLILRTKGPLSGAMPSDLRDDAVAGLHAAIGRQIGRQRLDPATEAAAMLLAAELREDGYLDVTVEELSQELSLPLPLLEQALSALQRCEPAGIGARSLSECLALQLIDRGVPERIARDLTSRLDDVARGRWSLLSRLLGLPAAEVERLADVIRSLSPRPVTESPPVTLTRVAELIVRQGTQGALVVSLVGAAAPKAAVMNVDRRSLQSEEMRALFDRARACVEALGHRSSMLLAIGRLIVARQSAYFSGGQTSLVPLTRAEAAAELSVHPSTLGRAIWGKALSFNGRVLPLDLFFARRGPGSDPALSAFDVQRQIRAIVAAENPAAPLADEAICAQLRAEGVDIARRTVAKYRKCLRIVSSFERRRR